MNPLKLFFPFVVAATAFSCLPSSPYRNLEGRRHMLDTTFFTGSGSTVYEPVIRAAIMQTDAYQHFKTTKEIDSLLLYLKQAEITAMKKMAEHK